MKVTLKADFEVNDSACREATGKSLSEWLAALEAHGTDSGRRDVIQWLYNEMGRGKDTWWATTVWVEYERSKGIVNKKDGLAEGYNICVTKAVKASAQAVYDAFTQAGKNGWLGCTAAEEGAAYADDGANSGTWVRLRPGKDVRLTWKTNGVDTPTAVDATFTEKDGKTAIAVMHNRIQTRDEADGLRNAWSDALNRLKAQLEG